MRINLALSAVLSITLIASISCTNVSNPSVQTTVSKAPATISITPKSGKAGTKFDISCNNLDGIHQVGVKVLQSDGTLVIDKSNTSHDSSTFTISISTFGFNPGHYQCNLEDGDGKQKASAEFDVTGTKKTLFEDDFSNGNSGWPIYESEQWSATYDIFQGEPVYHIKTKTLYCCPIQKLGEIGNFVAEVDCWPTTSPTFKYCQIVFRFVQEANTWEKTSYYALGDWGGVLKVINGIIYPLGLPYYMQARKWDQPNRLKIACNGSITECYINEIQVLTFEDDTRAGKGYIGLSASGENIDAIFDNFTVYQIK